MDFNFKSWKIIFWLLLLMIIFFPAYAKIHQLKAKNSALSKEIENLEKKGENLKQENERLKKDPVYIEEVAREKLKVARENEIVLRVVENEEEK